MNTTHQNIEDSLKLKLKQIKKLDVLQQDLDKLKQLSELPDKLKSSIEKYHKFKRTSSAADQLSQSIEPQETIADIFGDSIQIY